MQFINYFFASILAFLGLIGGILLVKIAPEEQKPLKKYFIFLRKILLLLIFAFAVFYYTRKSFGFSVPRKSLIFAGFSDAFSLIVLIAYFLFLLFVEYKINDLLKKSMVVYTFLGILLFLSSKSLNLFVIEASLIFLYGMPTASLLYNKKEKNHYKIVFYNIGFILVANLLFFL